MKFEYSEYLICLLVLPAAIACFAAPAVIGMVKGILTDQYSSKNKPVSSIVLSVLVLLVCLAPMVQHVINGGIYLLFEDENSAITTQGEVLSITEPSERFPGFKTNHQYGADIVIDGKTYFAITAGFVTTGDTVTITYLPQSLVILELNLETDAAEQ